MLLLPHSLNRSIFQSPDLSTAAKKHAKLLLFFDITKYFCKKNQKNAILHDLFGSLSLLGLHK